MSGGKYGSQELRMIYTARRLFTEKGFAGTTMSDIASETGVKRSTLHYHFANKDVMFQAVFGTMVESLVPRLQEIMQSDLPFMERLELMIDEYFMRFTENPSFPRFIMSEIQRDVDRLIDTAKAMHVDEVFSGIRAALVVEMDEGRIRPVPVSVVFTTFYGLITFPFLSKQLYVSWLRMSGGEFQVMIEEWKTYVLRQMKSLLLD